MQGCADIARRLGVLVEQHVLPRDQHVVEDDQRVDLVEAVGERIVLGRRAAGEAGAADEFEPRRAEIADEADGVVGELGIAPIGDRRLGEGLIGIGRRSLVLGAAHDDPGIGLLDDMEQHVGVLILRPLRAVALGIGVCRDVERVLRDGALDMGPDVDGEARIDLVEQILPVIERPHLADRLVADAGDDAADLVEHGIGGAALGVPILRRVGQLEADGEILAARTVGHRVAMADLVLHVVDAGADVDQRLEHRMGRHVGDAFAVDIDLAAVAERIAILGAGTNHRLFLSLIRRRAARCRVRRAARSRVRYRAAAPPRFRRRRGRGR